LEWSATNAHRGLNHVNDGLKLFDTKTTFSSNLSAIEALRKIKQARNIADDNLFSGLRVNVNLEITA